MTPRERAYAVIDWINDDRVHRLGSDALQEAIERAIEADRAERACTDIPAIERTALEAALFGGEVPLVSAESIAWIQGVAVRVKVNVAAAVERERDEALAAAMKTRIAELETLLRRARREPIGSNDSSSSEGAEVKTQDAGDASDEGCSCATFFGTPRR